MASKAKKSKSKKKRQSKREGFERFLRDLGILEEVAAAKLIPIVMNPWSRLAMEVAVSEELVSALPADARRTLLLDMERAASRARFRVGESSIEVSAKKYIELATPFLSFFDLLKRDRDLFDRQAQRRLDKYLVPIRHVLNEDVLGEALEAFHASVAGHLEAHSTIDGAFFWPLMKREDDDNVRTFTYELNVEPCRPLVVEVDGKRRETFQCAMFDLESKGLLWLTWQGQMVGSSKGAELPVHIQRHALTNFCERLCAPSLGQGHHLLCEMLREPKALHRMNNANDKFLVPAGEDGRKVGYFVVQVVEDVVLVRTFLFLTMQGTPESERLFRQLRLRRADIEYLKLDSLEAFMDADLSNDDELVAILNECGCGHLLQLVPDEIAQKPHLGHARSIRDYLDMPSLAEELGAGRLNDSALAQQLRDHGFGS